LPDINIVEIAAGAQRDRRRNPVALAFLNFRMVYYMMSGQKV